MSRRWLIAVSVAAHVSIAAGMVVSGIWRLDRLDVEHRDRVDITVSPPPPAPSGGPVAAVTPKFTPKQHPHEPVQPTTRPPEAVTATSTTTTGSGPGTDTDTGKCLENCGSSTDLPADPVCGNGALEVGEQCDDGNTASGDGCSSTCQLEPKPRPQTRLVPPSVLQGLRMSGETQIHPSDLTQNRMRRDGATEVLGTLKVCVGADGGIASVTLLHSTAYADYDAALLSGAHSWRYRPYTLDGVPVPACSTVTFKYKLQ